MDSPQSVVSPLKTSVVPEPQSDNPERTAANLSKGIDGSKTDKPENHIGSLEVFVHQARDIHNICIYHKQDVYAKLCLTSDPEITVSTKIINGGGRNPVFNDNVRLNVKTVETSLKCEVFMMSRVKNYLEDQLLGFALVPLSEVVVNNGKLEKEFSLSSTDLFHSPAGFVQLSLSYNGVSPDVMAIPAISKDTEIKESESISCEFEKLEFPDPKIVNENQMMVSEYFGMSLTNDDSETSESLTASLDGVRLVESFSGDSAETEIHKHDSPPSSVSTNGISILSPSDSPKEIKPLDSAEKEKKGGDIGGGESESSEIAKPVITVNLEQEQKVVQQDIVDMYMKSMQQFTESLAKMKLPLDIESGPTSSGSSTSDEKTKGSKNNGSRVFYGSRAFF